MPNIKLNFSSQWPTIQVAKVITSGIGANAVVPHGMPYPPFVVGMITSSNETGYDVMRGLNVDATNIYMPSYPTGALAIDTVVVYAVDITTGYNYDNYTSQTGPVVQDSTGGALDLRKFMLHSRAVGPMLLNVSTKTYTNIDTTLTYTSPLSYPTFQFGWVRMVSTGVWQNAPLAGQAWPVLTSDGFTSTLATTIQNGTYDANFMLIPGTGTVVADKGTIITLRNPAIITENTVEVTI